MKISDLLGEGWESEERSDATTEPRATGYTPTAPVAPVAPLSVSSPDPALAEPEPVPVSARAQLADLAAGLSVPETPLIETDALEDPDGTSGLAGLAGLSQVVDDLLPDATKRSKGSSRGSSRSGSRRRGQ
jgi:hypothetical protein